MVRVFAALAILSASQAWAEGTARPVFEARTSAKNCSPIDARVKKPSLKEFYATPKSQDAMGWCYASAAADLFSHKLGFPVSSVDLAVSYNYDIQSSARKRTARAFLEALGVTKKVEGAYQGGFIGYAVKDGHKYGLCPASRIPSKSADKYENPMELRTLIQAISQLADFVQKQGIDREEFKLGMECAEHVGAQNFYKTYFPGLDMAELYDLIVAEAGKDVNQMVFKLTQAHCAGQRVLPPKNLKMKQPPRDLWFASLDSQLKRGNILGIEFFTRMLRGKAAGPLAGHAASVVGREFIDGECRYLVRNSWASGCGAYSEELQAFCNEEDGTVWVSERLMDRYMKTVTYLE